MRRHGGQTAPGAGVGQEAGGAGAQPRAALARVGEHPGRRGGRPGAGGARGGRQVRVLLVRRGREATLPDTAGVLQQRRHCLLGGGAIQLLIHLVGDRPGHRTHDHVARGGAQQGAAAQQPGEAGPGPRRPVAAARGHLAGGAPGRGDRQRRARGRRGRQRPPAAKAGSWSPLPSAAGFRGGRGPQLWESPGGRAPLGEVAATENRIPPQRCAHCGCGVRSPRSVPGLAVGSVPAGWHKFCSQTVGVQINRLFHSPAV